MTAPQRVDIAICERHGLRYNAAEGQGCVRCRREAGVATGAVPVTSTSTAVRTPPKPVLAAGPRHASTPLHLLLAAALVGATGALFWSAHREVVASFQNLSPDQAEAMFAEGEGEEEDGVDQEEAVFADDDEPEDAARVDPDPGAYPPDGVAIGPAEQQRQLDELMRQMQEDADVDAESARRRAERDGGGSDDS